MSGNTNSGRRLKPAGEKQSNRIQITLRFSDAEIAQIYARCHTEKKQLATWAREIVLTEITRAPVITIFTGEP